MYENLSVKLRLSDFKSCKFEIRVPHQFPKHKHHDIEFLKKICKSLLEIMYYDDLEVFTE